MAFEKTPKKVQKGTLKLSSPIQTPENVREPEVQRSNSTTFKGIKEWWYRGRAKSPNPSESEKQPEKQAEKQAEKQIEKLNEKSDKADKRSPSPSKEERASSPKNYVKSLRLTSDQLKALNLNHGSNSIKFSVTSRLQGKATCEAKIFLWKEDVKIVISDIDGTITKSDVMGHLFTMVGRDWTHNGVAGLYTSIHNNGYEILYLTSRAIGQADYTRGYLRGVEQGDYQLPEGPTFLSPDRLITAFRREVIMRKPEEFKIQCLKDIKRLFKSNAPFYAGFGNRITDAMSYRSVDIPPSRIFTINPQGDIKLELLNGYKSTYVQLNEMVDQIFPQVKPDVQALQNFNDFQYWNKPIDTTIDIEEYLNAPLKKKGDSNSPEHRSYSYL